MSTGDNAAGQGPLSAIVTPLAQAAMSQHELYREYIRAGFTPREALDLVKTFLVATMRPNCRCGS